MSSPIVNAAFYLFAPMAPIHPLEQALATLPGADRIKGSIILAYEGINAMIAGPQGAIEAYLEALIALRPVLKRAAVKRSLSDSLPFKKLTIKIKPEIVTLRAELDLDPSTRTAQHLSPQAFRDRLRGGQEMVLVDVRNDFEHQLGTFRGALNPRTRAFHQFPEVIRAHADSWRQRDVVMFCTGGIRCEKASSLMIKRGFERLYQLQGGVLNYFEAIPDAALDWDGELFVFDERVALDTDLRPSGLTLKELQVRFPD